MSQPSYYQHPTKTTIQTRSSTKLKSSSSPLKIPFILTEILLHLSHSDLLIGATLVCKEWKSVIDGEPFDAKLFRFRKEDHDNKSKSKAKSRFNSHLIRDQITTDTFSEFTLHPIFQQITYDTRHKTTSYHGDSDATHLEYSCTWPPVRRLRVGYCLARHPGKEYALYGDLVRSDEASGFGITIGDVLKYLKGRIKESNHNVSICRNCLRFHVRLYGSPHWKCNKWILEAMIGDEGADAAGVGLGVGVEGGEKDKAVALILWGWERV